MKNYDMHITSLQRYAVKGLSGDSIHSVTFKEGDGTFEDDRRFALLYDDRTEYATKSGCTRIISSARLLHQSFLQHFALNIKLI